MPEADTFGWDDATRRISKLIKLDCAILTWNQRSQDYHKESFKFHRKKYIFHFLKMSLDKCKK